MTKVITLLICGSLCFYSCSKEEDISTSAPQFITTDIDLFWETYDKSASLSANDFQKNYIDKGTNGLRDYAQQKNLASALNTTLNSNPYVAYYHTVRNNTLDVSEAIELSKEAFLSLQCIYPNTKFFKVYFLVGAMTAGGRVSDNGLLIAVEMFSKNADTPLNELSEWHQNVLRSKKYLPSIVVHEFVHLQQNFRSQNTNYKTTLEQSIVEGMADFIAFHLLEDQPFMNEHLHAYGDLWEEDIWTEFDAQKNLSSRDTEWLYTGSTTSNGHPADMGYYVGFKILESYSETFDTIQEAINAMLITRNYEEIFEQSGYANKFD
jgi:hypothetical protein